ncbi:hypothetical protein RRG08_014238 [Elysia crispata]|uniref:Uncharacterized protein n=1 Tax=Elysia crispata TaxID=231223 RepID=A0AAE0XER4_9GAST|nr:hypothetical protein RRG08_014238 [Elysia crispata]
MYSGCLRKKRLNFLRYTVDRESPQILLKLALNGSFSGQIPDKMEVISITPNVMLNDATAQMESPAGWMWERQSARPAYRPDLNTGAAHWRSLSLADMWLLSWVSPHHKHHHQSQAQRKVCFQGKGRKLQTAFWLCSANWQMNQQRVSVRESSK